jgi:hypothetical protein
MRLLTVSCAAASMVMLSFSPALANGRGGGNSSHGNPHTVTTTHGAPTKTHGGPQKMTTATAPAKTHGNPHTTTTSSMTTTKTHGNPKKTTTTTTTGTTTTPGSTTTGSTGSGSTTTGSTPGTTTGSTPGTTTTPHRERLNPIAQKISSKPQLAARLEAMLPQGMTLNSASRGFKNQGQFIAALQASQKNNIPFRDLKAAMLGKNGAAPMSLGQAKHSLRSAPTTPTPRPTPTPTPTPPPPPSGR